MSTFECSVDRNVLTKLLARAASASAAKSPIIGYTAVQLECDGTSLSVTATDGYVGMRSSGPATAKTPGKLAVDARRAVEVAKELPAGEVRIRVKGDHVEFTAGKAKLRLPVLRADDLPVLPKASDAKVLARIPANELLEALNGGSYAAANDDSRPQMSAVQVELGNEVAVVSTDGQRLALSKLKLEADAPGSVLLSHRAQGELRKFCESLDCDVTVSIDGHAVFFTCGEHSLNALVVDAVFPPWRKAIPSSHEHAVDLHRGSLIDAVKRVQAAAGPRTKQTHVALVFGSGQVLVTAEGETGGAGEDSVDCEAATFDMRVHLNPALLLDALKSIDDDMVRIELTGPNGWFVVKPASSDNQLAVIATIRQ